MTVLSSLWGTRQRAVFTPFPRVPSVPAGLGEVLPPWAAETDSSLPKLISPHPTPASAVAAAPRSQIHHRRQDPAIRQCRGDLNDLPSRISQTLRDPHGGLRQAGPTRRTPTCHWAEKTQGS
ncbi:hypothetical protein AAFF_G00423500 [Aldrovandia affinis]|uniref:Uncharacterized protein n=1 Tax=Aldrovandia affinis TaxID=143900 RepID=A0AAD7T6Q5_9TELE|nr:hypothetical protein AAFF_G00423500 [Aldrovandia affinis]